MDLIKINIFHLSIILHVFMELRCEYYVIKIPYNLLYNLE